MKGWWKRFLPHIRLTRPPPTFPLDPDVLAGDSTTLYAALADHWREVERPHYTPAHDAPAIDALERHYAIHIPAEFRAYLAHAAPRETFMDDYGTQWWSLDSIRSLADECPDGSPGPGLPAITAQEDRYLVFADYLMWCCAWAICCADGPDYGRIALIGGGAEGFVAKDFRTFVERALTGSVELHRPTAQ
ncbi:hypothetical protein N4G62_16610 [Sphingomonas sanguinis]|uniref:Knr4/Smi1-like domain-containing protein n=1 Tax=Sphingomonas sanguinis TaxID=33051 RepID=A0ABU5LUQ5_9SPHN|nr:hypothetical protein [Sphingomonas sanguinis]MDZ7283651.1 hypothetical protein [Sphingomonas sanguinis]